MVRPLQLDTSLKRLSAALDQLEAAATRLGKASAEKRDIEDTLTLMQEDRGRLAGKLDEAMTRTQALEQATDEVGLRLRSAGTILRRLLIAPEEDLS